MVNVTPNRCYHYRAYNIQLYSIALFPNNLHRCFISRNCDHLPFQQHQNNNYYIYIHRNRTDPNFHTTNLVRNYLFIIYLVSITKIRVSRINENWTKSRQFRFIWNELPKYIYLKYSKPTNANEKHVLLSMCLCTQCVFVVVA